MDLPDSDRGDFNCLRAVDSSSLLSFFLCPTKVCHILWIGMVHPSVFTGVTACRINFNFTDIIHLVCLIHDTGNGSSSSLNMTILT